MLECAKIFVMVIDYYRGFIWLCYWTGFFFFFVYYTIWRRKQRIIIFSYFIFMFLADRDEYGLNNVNNNELDGIFIFILLISRRLYWLIYSIELHGEREPITLEAITENIYIWYWNGCSRRESNLNLHNFNGFIRLYCDLEMSYQNCSSCGRFIENICVR